MKEKNDLKIVPIKNIEKESVITVDEFLSQMAEAVKAANDAGRSITDFVLVLKSEVEDENDPDCVLTYYQPISYASNDPEIVHTLTIAIKTVIHNGGADLI